MSNYHVEPIPAGAFRFEITNDCILDPSKVNLSIYKNEPFLKGIDKIFGHTWPREEWDKFAAMVERFNLKLIAKDNANDQTITQ